MKTNYDISGEEIYEFMKSNSYLDDLTNGDYHVITYDPTKMKLENISEFNRNYVHDLSKNPDIQWFRFEALGDEFLGDCLERDKSFVLVKRYKILGKDRSEHDIKIYESNKEIWEVHNDCY
jgi:hypothetical protein